MVMCWYFFLCRSIVYFSRISSRCIRLSIQLWSNNDRNLSSNYVSRQPISILQKKTNYPPVILDFVCFDWVFHIQLPTEFPIYFLSSEFFGSYPRIRIVYIWGDILFGSEISLNPKVLAILHLADSCSMPCSHFSDFDWPIRLFCFVYSWNSLSEGMDKYRYLFH